MKHTSKLFKTALTCAAFMLTTNAFISCANGTSTTGSDTAEMSAPAAADTMASPSSSPMSDTTSKMPMDTARRDSM